MVRWPSGVMKHKQVAVGPAVVSCRRVGGGGVLPSGLWLDKGQGSHQLVQHLLMSVRGKNGACRPTHANVVLLLKLPVHIDWPGD
jgi:hypothetical protein